MFTYQIIVEYLGTNFVGWQIQKNGLSVQEALEKVLSKFLKEKIRVIGSGRTDAGVHANEQSAHFKTKNKIIDKNIFINSINFFLKKNPISILSIKKKSNKFHARHSAKERIYKYFVINRSSSLVLERNKAWHIKKSLDVKIMRKGADILKGTHNFSTFRASSCQAKSPIKTLKKVIIKKNKNKIVLIFQSKSFLQQQVRSMVGSLKYLGEGKWNLNDFKKAFLSKNRTMCAPPAPAHGLYLTKVIY
ncbi:tRNA pseudouridine(38-40) synthase TruA [Pelagibacterales bacterium SAG-MED29]|nr:tRNA pseudouridine(38-40) synthase TruA [Pelagibacterales bacterium SAG-MED29]